jgi:hypothetical protein
MDQPTAFDKIELQELANKLFMYTDAQDWNKVLQEVFTENVWFDMQSAGGGEPKQMAAAEICEMWHNGFAGLDAVHHQAGHYLIEVNKDKATIFGYAMATHFKAQAQRGKTRMVVGSYDLKAVRTGRGWRLNQFKYNLKYIDGNPTLE